MLRVIGVLIFALIVLGLAGHLFYKNKSRNETSQVQPQWQHRDYRPSLRISRVLVVPCTSRENNTTPKTIDCTVHQ